MRETVNINGSCLAPEQYPPLADPQPESGSCEAAEPLDASVSGIGELLDCSFNSLPIAPREFREVSVCLLGPLNPKRGVRVT